MGARSRFRVVRISRRDHRLVTDALGFSSGRARWSYPSLSVLSRLNTRDPTSLC